MGNALATNALATNPHAIIIMTQELSLQDLQSVSGGNYLDNLGNLNALAAAVALPRINVGLFSQPTAIAGKVKTPSIAG